MTFIIQDKKWRKQVDNDCIDLFFETRNGHKVKSLRFLDDTSGVVVATIDGFSTTILVQLNGRKNNQTENEWDIIKKPNKMPNLPVLKADSDHHKTNHIKTLLKRKHGGAGWALMFEVSDRIHDVKSRADAIAFDIYKYKIHGYEIKASRGDWMNELKNPEKSARISKYCDFWWVIAPKNMIHPKELPEGWGLIEAGPNSLRKKVLAPQNFRKDPMHNGFLAAMLRVMNNQKAVIT